MRCADHQVLRRRLRGVELDFRKLKIGLAVEVIPDQWHGKVVGLWRTREPVRVIVELRLWPPVGKN